MFVSIAVVLYQVNVQCIGPLEHWSLAYVVDAYPGSLTYHVAQVPAEGNSMTWAFNKHMYGPRREAPNKPAWKAKTVSADTLPMLETVFKQN